MAKKKLSFISVILILIVGFSVGVAFDRIFLLNDNDTASLTSEQRKAINQALNIVNQYAIEEHDQNFNVDYALKGIAASLDDEYAYYYSAEELEEFNKSTSGVVEKGIGINFLQDEGKTVIVSVYKGLTADAAGIKVGDVIKKINDVSVEGLATDEIAALAKQNDDTLMLEVEREGVLYTYLVNKTDGQREMVEYKMLDNSILYTKIISFRGNAVECFKKALDFGVTNGYTGLIVDVRDNPGGELDTFAKIADMLLPEGELFYAKMRSGEKTSVKESDAKCINVPVCVLVNGSSASASEAFAGAMRCLSDTQIIGVKTYGKGIMQTTFTLANGGAFKLTVGKYYLPNDECVHEVGITPDIVVELPEELNVKYWLLNQQNDLQLKKAIEVLTNN